MNLGAKGEALIKSFEKLRLAAYKPTPHDVWTIGWGHTRGVVEGSGCNEAKAQQWFRYDTDDAVQCVNTAVSAPLTQNQFDALVSFAFNIGVHNFIDSTLLMLLNKKDYEGAAEEFCRWNKQAGTVLTGLTARREAERALYESN